MGKGCEYMCVHVNVHQKVTSAEEELNNQVGKMTHSVDSQPLSPAISVIAQWPLNKWPWWQRRGLG